MNSPSRSVAGNSEVVLQERLTTAQLARKNGDSDLALQIYGELRLRFPAEPAPVLEAAKLMREAGRYEEAELWLDAALECRPEDTTLLAERAWLAHDRRDWAEAERRWAVLREGFPGDPWGYFGAGRSLLAARRVEEAEALFADAAERFPENPGIAEGCAECATRRGDWTEAARRWAKYRGLVPAAPAGYVQEAAALAFLQKDDEADALLAEALQRFPDEPRVIADTVWTAFRRGMTDEAAQRFERAAARHRGSPPTPASLDLTGRIFNRLRMPDPPAIERYLQQRAGEAIYIPRAPEISLRDPPELHAFVARHIGTNRPVRLLEFGVAQGGSIRGFARLFTHPDSRFTGFDSFRGLPEHWHDKAAGTFSTGGKTPATDDPRIEFVSGWFQDTLPGFLARLSPSEATDRTILVHFDADLYSSTLFVLAMLWNVFDSYYFIADELRLDEIVALYDFARAFPIQIEFHAGIGSGSGVPMCAFGQIRRAAFDAGIKMLG